MWGIGSAERSTRDAGFHIGDCCCCRRRRRSVSWLCLFDKTILMHSYYSRINTVFFTTVYCLAAVSVFYAILWVAQFWTDVCRKASKPFKGELIRFDNATVDSMYELVDLCLSCLAWLICAIFTFSLWFRWISIMVRVLNRVYHRFEQRLGLQHSQYLRLRGAFFRWRSCITEETCWAVGVAWAYYVG